MKLRFLSLVCSLFITAVGSVSALEGEPISTISQPYLLVEIESTLEGEDFMLNLMGNLNPTPLEIDWDGVKYKYTVSGTSNEIKQPLSGGGSKTIKIYSSSIDAIRYLNIKESAIKEIDFKEELTRFVSLEILDNFNMESIDLSNLPDLTGFIYEGRDGQESDLTNIVLNENVKLETLRIPYQTKLTTLDLSGNPKLKILFAWNSGLSNPNLVANNPDLEDLQILDSRGFSGGINLSNNSKLKNISCYGNDMTSLNLSACTALVSLRCQNNKLETLDLSNSPSLDVLYCQNNELTTLKLAESITTLDIIQCQNNKLSFAERPRVTGTNPSTTSSFANQSYLVKAELVGDGYTVVVSDEDLPAIAGGTYKIEWWWYQGASASVIPPTMINNSMNFVTVSSDGKRCTLSPTILNMLSDHRLFAKVTNNASVFGPLGFSLNTETILVTGISTNLNTDKVLNETSVVYNQSTGELNVSVTENSEVDIVNIQGISVHKLKILRGDEIISLSQIPSGLYLVKVNSLNKKSVNKIVKK